MIADLRATCDGALPEAARRAGLHILNGATIVGTAGTRKISQVSVGRVAGGAETTVDRIACDALLMCGGWTPSVHLYSQSRGKVVYDESIGAFVPGASIQRERSVGGCRGTFNLAAVLAEGFAAGSAASGRSTRDEVRSFSVAGAPVGDGGLLGVLPQPRRRVHAMAFVDFQNDVCAKDIELAVREGMRSIEHIKRYTTTGMATDQGKTSNMNALAIAARDLDKPSSRGRPHDLPATLYTRHFRLFRRGFTRRFVRSRAQDADPRLG